MPLAVGGRPIQTTKSLDIYRLSGVERRLRSNLPYSEILARSTLAGLQPLRQSYRQRIPNS